MLESDTEPGTLTDRLDEPLPYEISEAEARRMELRRQARENRGALSMLGGLSLKG